jgi:hypothetical protein
VACLQRRGQPHRAHPRRGCWLWRRKLQRQLPAVRAGRWICALALLLQPRRTRNRAPRAVKLHSERETSLSAARRKSAVREERTTGNSSLFSFIAATRPARHSIGDEAEPTCRFAPLRESAVPRLHRGARRGWPRSSKRHFDPQPRTALGLEHSAGRCLELGHGGATAGTIGRAARCARARARGLLEVKLLLEHHGRYFDSM